MIEKALCCMSNLIVDLQCGVDVQVCICKLPNKPSYWPGAVICLEQNVCTNFASHAPSLLQNTRLSSDEANPLSRSRN